MVNVCYCNILAVWSGQSHSRMYSKYGVNCRFVLNIMGEYNFTV